MKSFNELVRVSYAEQRADGYRARDALALAKHKVMYGRFSPKRQCMPCGTGQQITNLPNGMSYHIEVAYDEANYNPPWEDFDCHGFVTDWVDYGNDGDNWLLNSDRGLHRYYDWKPSLKKALAENWGVRGVNPHERAMDAIKADYDYLRRWCSNDWWYVNLTVTLFDEHENEIGFESCCGFESDCEAYLCEIARGCVASLLVNERRARRATKKQARIANRFRDALTCGV
jgi:hypothetical protein